ncbi:PREDICTED: ubiquitin carboxyl-terminal hydrolase 47-like [Amphimedon queenslandica]|uniref:Ubiquitin carboxyl-terminal hydrolase 47 C-terminal domain-containing protein n=1 Tax=Amphimedon queenslandica TaxID=400682 RepID=A0AAN0J254_AMPQE|nr:PREDICTED: ubiquitin carboxyl-terminal hydrolase 47-like [Amphimedon queenslandica]|eukprot:XP_019851090.1 PREDICTED: ubiquitin carboxyl-terminal hydrolase 47-like [Amphimedon queenslandica]
MFYNVGKIIKRKSPPLEEIKEFLSCRSIVFRRKVEKCTNISGVLRLIQNDCSLTDIELLHSVVEEMEITEATRYIEAYRTELKEFCKSLSISLCLKERFASIPPLQCETVTFVLDWEPEEHVLKDIKDILSKMSVDYIVQELKEKDQDSLQRTDVISYIILEEAECKLRDAISSKEKETIKLKQELSMMKVLEEESLSVQSDTESVKEVEEEPLYEELTVLSSQFNEIQKENKELTDKLSKIKVEYLRLLSLSSNTDSAARKLRRGMSFEIDDCKFHLKAMKRLDYQPLVGNKRIIEKLQERITLMNMELMTEREHNEKIIKDIKDLTSVEDKETSNEEIEYVSLKDEMKDQICSLQLYCNHPVTGRFMKPRLKVHKDELLPTVLDKAYELMELAPHIPIERCRLVKYDYENDVMEQSFDLDEFKHQTIGQIVGGTRLYYPFGLFIETREENEIFDKYHSGGNNLLISVVDLSTGKVGPGKLMRVEEGWTVGEFKKHIGEAYNLNSSCMRLLLEEKNDVTDISDAGSTLGKIFRKSAYKDQQLVYVSSNPEEFQKEFKRSLTYRHVSKLYLINRMLLNITIPLAPGPKATPTTTNVPEGGIIRKFVLMKEETKGKERKIQVLVDKRITLAQLKEELVPLIGVPPTGFIVYGISGNREYEMKRLNSTSSLQYIGSGSELIIRLGRPLQEGEHRITLYLLQVNNTVFCKFMMESIVAKGTPVREFKKQIIEEAKAQGIDCVLELDKMRIRDKRGASPGRVYYLDDELINTSREMYVEPLKGPEEIKHDQHRQVYVIRWRPSQCSVDPIEEIILDRRYDPNHVIEKLSELSGVPAEFISYSQERLFPVETHVSCLDIENKLTWHSITSATYSLGLYDDGRVIYYKDNRETMKELTDKERSKFQEAEKARLRRIKKYTSKYRHRYGYWHWD